ncbi:type I-C CRISPR-associated protein Cas8c/Csd1, partial [bacterium]|nr:type I-C CRISPR-associated protein Cas8c/Csd1 [bacterium]
MNGEDSPTLIPATEASAGRSGSKVAPHPLCEEIGYCAADYPNTEPAKAEAYISQLEEWVDSENTHPKLRAIYSYLQKNELWSDLLNEFDFPLKIVKKDGKSQKISAEKTFIRWSVVETGNPICGTWEDESLIKSWIAHDAEVNTKTGFCSIIGRESRVALNHPRFLRWPGDGAKLISSNDHSGFTFRGRFTDSKSSIGEKGLQTVSIGFEVTQKAHNALRWLLNKQGYRNGDQVYVAWAVSGHSIPDPLMDSWSMLGEEVSLQLEEEHEPNFQIDQTVDLGASFAHSFNKYLAGYRTRLEPNEQIIVMGLDSATPGRMGVIYYRELLASEFLDRIHNWHSQFSWPQRHTKEYSNPKNKKNLVRKTIWPVSTPVPRSIAEAAYGNVLKSNDKLKKSLLERVLPCIVDGRPFPRDVMVSAVRRACNRNNCEHWEWERNLGIACALYKGFYQSHPDKIKRRNYVMTLELDRNTRDYLYGRLLAIAERIEAVALSVSGENRPTTAARLMQRFADRPYSTWRNIELGLQPYMQRLQ